jgi:hypothetical protein
MALIVEDGTIIAGANSYVSRTDIIGYASARGIILADDDATDVLAIKAMDYLALFDDQWKGSRVTPEQDLAWPRKNARTSAGTLSPEMIPTALVRAQCELCLIANAGNVLLPTTTAENAFIKKEKVDVIETEYSEAVALKMLGQLPQMPLVDAMLKPLLDVSVGLKTRRV